MHLFLFLLAIVTIGLLLFYFVPRSNAIVSSEGYLYPNPMFDSGRGHQQLKRKHNMLRVSKFKRK